LNLTDKQKIDLEFVESAVVVQPIGSHIHDSWDEKFLPQMKEALDSGNDNILWLHQEEVFWEQYQLDFVYEKMKQYPDKNIKLMCSTTTKIDLFVEPLINIYQWGNTKTRRDISWWSPTDCWTLHKDNFLTNDNKDVKGILSWRKAHNDRTYVYNSDVVTNGFDGIKRYGEWKANPNDEKDDTYTDDYINSFPTLYELTQEYNKSYVSFVFETESPDIMNQFSEKLLISFLSKTMPIVHGGKGMISELEKMGLKVWNNEFGFDDNIPNYTKKRNNSYIDCIKRYNEMSSSQIKEMYDKYRVDIEKNFEIVSWFINKGGF